MDDIIGRDRFKKTITRFIFDDLNVHIDGYLEGKRLKEYRIPDVDLRMRCLIVRFDYPLSMTVFRKFEAKDNFTLAKLISRICRAYRKIYKEERETSAEPEKLHSINGKYGIWGHTLYDLYIEAIELDEDGSVQLHIGS